MSREVVVESIITSESETREFRGLVLPNGLRVVLVSDPTAEKAAAALSVSVGHFSDPAAAAGLAHFCEHMLFLGTAKYPDESEYQNYISKNGGSSNASTSMEHTQYYFDVRSDALAGALDRFASFFVSPLFTESATGREMNAVHSEHTKNLQSDGHRLFILDKLSCSREHPFSKFGTGNLETLNVDGIRDMLLAFHAKHYAASRMNLAVVGKEPLDELQALVLPLFADVRDFDSQPDPITVKPWDAEQLGMMYELAPVRELLQLDLSFPLPAQPPVYLKKPARLLSHLIGHEGPGSLISLLRRRGWATGLSAGSAYDFTDCSVFNVGIELTQVGATHVDDIMKLVFEYIAILRVHGVPSWTFDEVKAVADMTLRFYEKTSPMSTSTTLIGNMRRYPLRDAIRAPYYYESFDADLVRETVALLRPDNMIAKFTAPEVAERATETERWYAARYRAFRLSAETLASLAAAAPGTTPELHLPERNPFIATDFSLVPLPAVDAPPAAPTMVVDDARVRAWHRYDHVFRRPRSSIFLQLNSPVSYATPLDVVCARLLIELVSEDLIEYSYFAEIAGLQFSMSPTLAGMQINFQGYSQKMPELVAAVTRRLRSIVPTPDRFAVQREAVQRYLVNLTRQQPYMFAMTLSRALTDEHFVYFLDQHKAAMEVTLDDVLAFQKTYLDTVQIEALIEGNVSVEDAKMISLDAAAALNTVGRARDALFRQGSIELAPTDHLAFGLPSTNPDEVNNAVIVRYEAGLYEPRKHSILSLIESIASEPAFSQLRTREQLGYIVAIQMRVSSAATLGLQVIVQSHVKDPVYLHHRVAQFMQRFSSQLAATEPDVFKSFVDSLINQRLEKAKTCAEEAQRHWPDVSDGLYRFDRREKQVEELRTITLAEVVAFYEREIVAAGPIGNLATYVFGNKHPVRAPSAFSASEVPAEGDEAVGDAAASEAVAAKLVQVETVAGMRDLIGKRPLYPQLTPQTN